jgi:hypothetical protein
MSINLNALTSTFKVPTLDQKVEKAKFRKLQAAFYSLRDLMWQDSKGRVFKDALDNGSIEAIAPAKRLPDGNWSRAEFDEDDIKDLYATAWEIFTEEFDTAFISATAEEIGQYSLAHFGQTLQQLLELNDKRSAERNNR